MRNKSILVRVPATVGNVANVQNQAALALDASLNLKATRKADGHLNIRYFGENGERVPRDRTNLAARAFEAALHYRGLEFAGVDFEVYSTIPIGFGLGSSTAAVWAGMVSANLLYGLELDEKTLFDLAGIFEPRSANLRAAWNGGLAAATGPASPFNHTRVSQEFSVVALVSARSLQSCFAPTHAENGEKVAQYRLAADLVAYLSRPDSGRPSFAQTAPVAAGEDLLAIAETLEAAGSAPLALFLCGGGPALGFLTRGLTPESTLNLQEGLIRRGLARKVWTLRPANYGAQEWNAVAVVAPVPVEVGEEVELAKAAHLTA